LLEWNNESTFRTEMADENLMLPCEKCGKLIYYDGVSFFGAKTVCEYCGSKNPHTIRGNPAFPFAVFFLGALLLVLVDPFGLSQQGYFFLFFGPFCLMLWFKALLPFYIAQFKGYHQMTGCQNFALGCLSFVLLVTGSICLFFVVLTMYN
jgi:hypothetical protein